MDDTFPGELYEYKVETMEQIREDSYQRSLDYRD